MLSALRSAFATPDLRRKILFSLGIMAVYRFGATVPSPGVSYVVRRIDGPAAQARLATNHELKEAGDRIDNDRGHERQHDSGQAERPSVGGLVLADLSKEPAGTL